MKRNIRRILSFFVILALSFTSMPMFAIAEGDITYSENTDITANENYNHITINTGVSVALKAPNGRLCVNQNGSLTIQDSGTFTADSGQILEIKQGATVTGLTLYARLDESEMLTSFSEITTTMWEEGQILEGMDHIEFAYDSTESKWILQEEQEDPEPPEQPECTYCVRYDTNAIEVKLGENSFEYENQPQSYPTASGTSNLVFSFQAKPAGEGQPDNRFYGLRVTVDGEPRVVNDIKAGNAGLLETGSGTGVYTYTIAEENFDKNIELEAITKSMAFSNEFYCSYDNQNNANVKYSVGGGEQVDLANEDIKAFNSGTSYTFTLIPPTDVIAPFKVVQQLSNGSPSEITVESNAFTWTPSANTGCSFRIYWSEAQYNYENLQAGENQYEVEYSWRGNGTVSHTGGVNSATYSNQTKVIVTNETNSISITMIPTVGGEQENTIEEVNDDGQVVDQTNYSGGIYLMPLNGNYKRLEVRFTEDSPGGGDNPGDNPPQAPKYKVRYQTDAVEVKLGNVGFSNEGQEQNYPSLTEETDDLVFSFEAKQAGPNAPANKFYGLKVTTDGETPVVQYIKAGASGLAETANGSGIYTYTIPESAFTNNIEIEAITWAKPFNNEFILHFEGNNNAGVGYSYSGNAATSITSEQAYGFANATTYNFTLTPPTGITNTYKVIKEVNDGPSSEVTVTNNSFSWTPSDNQGCSFRVYWSQDQYDFEQLRANQDEGQYEVELSWDGRGTVSYSGSNSQATYNKLTKIICDNSTTSLSVNIMPETDYSVMEVRLNGENVPAADYSTGVYTLHLGNNFGRLEVRFSDTPIPSGGNTQRDFNLKQNIDNRSFAYSGTTSTQIKNKFVEEIWETAFENNTQSHFATIEELTDKVTVGTSLISIESEIAGKSYYTFSIDIDNDGAGSDLDDCNGKIYVLTGDKDFVVRATKGATKTFILVVDPGTEDPDSAEVVMDYDTGGLLVFGNGAEMVGGLGSTSSLVSAHVTNEHVPNLLQFGRKLAVYKPAFLGTSVATSGEPRYAAAWGFAQYPVATTNDTTPTSPAEYEVYFGNTSVTLSKPSVTGTAVQKVTNVTTSLPDTAVQITNIGTVDNPNFNVVFLSNFYDEVPVTITYETSTGSVTQYLEIRRVGIDIAGYRQSGDHENNLNLLHGTDSGPVLNNFWDVNGKCGVFATYYYPSGTDTANTTTVELYVTKTWYAANGGVARVERETIQNSIQHTNPGAVGSSVATDDFKLYEGPSAECPDKIEVISLKTGSSESSFEGANLGGGAGVVWEKLDRFN